MPVVAHFDFMVDAHIAMGLLRAEGIDCELLDEHMVQTDWTCAIAVGGIKLTVEERNVARATAVLNADHSNELDGLMK